METCPQCRAAMEEVERTVRMYWVGVSTMSPAKLFHGQDHSRPKLYRLVATGGSAGFPSDQPKAGKLRSLRKSASFGCQSGMALVTGSIQPSPTWPEPSIIAWKPARPRYIASGSSAPCEGQTMVVSAVP